MADSESKETKDREGEEILGTSNTEKKKRKRHSKEENRSKECSNSSIMYSINRGKTNDMFITS